MLAVKLDDTGLALFIDASDIKYEARYLGVELSDEQVSKILGLIVEEIGMEAGISRYTIKNYIYQMKGKQNV